MKSVILLIALLSVLTGIPTHEPDLPYFEFAYQDGSDLVFVPVMEGSGYQWYQGTRNRRYDEFPVGPYIPSLSPGTLPGLLYTIQIPPMEVLEIGGYWICGYNILGASFICEFAESEPSHAIRNFKPRRSSSSE